MIVAQYLLCLGLVLAGSFSWPLLLVLIGLPALRPLFRIYSQAKPDVAPHEYPQGIWPLWFSAYAFRHTRQFTSLFLLGVILDTLIR